MYKKTRGWAPRVFVFDRLSVYENGDGDRLIGKIWDSDDDCAYKVLKHNDQAAIFDREIIRDVFVHFDLEPIPSDEIFDKEASPGLEGQE